MGGGGFATVTICWSIPSFYYYCWFFNMNLVVLGIGQGGRVEAQEACARQGRDIYYAILCYGGG